MAQVQCPNCGGYKIDEKAFVRKPKSGQLSFDQIALILLVSFGLGSWWLWKGNTLWGVLSIVGGLISYTILLALLSNRPSVYHRTCMLCGYKWTWESGQPEPRIRVRPDLIQKGMQKLEEEEREEREERQRQQEEAAYWLHQQMKK